MNDKEKLVSVLNEISVTHFEVKGTNVLLWLGDESNNYRKNCFAFQFNKFGDFKSVSNMESHEMRNIEPY